jgi:hypothetical protein
MPTKSEIDFILSRILPPEFAAIPEYDPFRGLDSEEVRKGKGLVGEKKMARKTKQPRQIPFGAKERSFRTPKFDWTRAIPTGWKFPKGMRGSNYPTAPDPFLGPSEPPLTGLFDDVLDEWKPRDITAPEPKLSAFSRFAKSPAGKIGGKIVRGAGRGLGALTAAEMGNTALESIAPSDKYTTPADVGANIYDYLFGSPNVSARTSTSVVKPQTTPNMPRYGSAADRWAAIENAKPITGVHTTRTPDINLSAKPVMDSWIKDDEWNQGQGPTIARASRPGFGVQRTGDMLLPPMDGSNDNTIEQEIASQLGLEPSSSMFPSAAPAPVKRATLGRAKPATSLASSFAPWPKMPEGFKATDVPAFINADTLQPNTRNPLATLPELGEISSEQEMSKEMPTVFDMYRKHWENRPNRDEFKPSVWNRIAASLVGGSEGYSKGAGAGYAAARNVVEYPFEQKMGDWNKELENLEPLMKQEVYTEIQNEKNRIAEKKIDLTNKTKTEVNEIARLSANNRHEEAMARVETLIQRNKLYGRDTIVANDGMVHILDTDTGEDISTGIKALDYEKFLADRDYKRGMAGAAGVRAANSGSGGFKSPAAAVQQMYVMGVIDEATMVRLINLINQNQTAPAPVVK